MNMHLYLAFQVANNSGTNIFYILGRTLQTVLKGITDSNPGSSKVIKLCTRVW